MTTYYRVKTIPFFLLQKLTTFFQDWTTCIATAGRDSGGLLIKARLSFERRHPGRRAEGPQLFGQELNPVTYAIARMNMLLHDFQGARIVTGDTMRRPGFGAAGAGLMQFDRVVANPMWNQKNFPDSLFEADSWGRFPHGAPPSASADWAWVQHIAASLRPHDGRAAIVLDTGAVSRGSGSSGASRERDIRAALVEADLKCVDSQRIQSSAASRWAVARKETAVFS